ncbi:zinc-binding dehydrogenase [Dactylosporangium sp. AC04546]|uniref:zinc-binding dehydrogenase n=1 Tax=Dactylosporangium sp. AC04546 TaxID=2862460 RepID=UPI001EDCA0F1|nr:zinc-binding dehydrogenase [Dactylosporangium sp. AC04546]WVK89194.1 zinc-binding dehydrogenase [Dactylosporangium sp. AC04546]
MTNIDVRLAAPVAGPPTLTDLLVHTSGVPEPGPGQVLVRNRWIALGAVQRTLMARGVLVAKCLGEVAGSGDLVTHTGAWSTHVVADPAMLRPVQGAAGAPDAPDAASAARLIGSAPVALAALRAAGLRAGESVLVTGAAGGLGSAAGAVARSLGAGRVAGTTGSAWKVPLLTGELGFDAAAGHASLAEAVDALGPLDVVVDTLGRVEELVAAVAAGTRIALCGALSQQLGGAADPRLDLTAVILKRLTLVGATAGADQGGELPAGLSLPYTVIEGLSAAPQALLDLFAGRHTGTVLVRV